VKLKDDSEEDDDVDWKIYIKVWCNARLERIDLREIGMSLLCFHYFEFEKNEIQEIKYVLIKEKLLNF